MTGTNYMGGLRRMNGPTVDDICASWKLDYNMGKMLEAIRDSVNADPVTRIDKLKDISVRVNRAISETERNMVVSMDVSNVDDHKCVMREKPETVPTNGASDVKIGSVKADVPKAAPKADITNGPRETDPIAALREVITKAGDAPSGKDGGVADIMSSVIDILGIKPPEGLDAETIRSMDQMVREAIDAVAKIKGRSE